MPAPPSVGPASDNGVTTAQVLAALRQVADPDRGQDIVALGMIQGLTVRDGHVGFSIEVDAQRGPRLEPLRIAAEKAVDALPGVLSVTAVLTAEKAAAAAPQRQQGHGQGHGHAHGHAHGPAQGGPQGGGPQGGGPRGGGAAQAPKPLIPGVRTIIAVASGKGGVGKSTTAVNLALALKQKGLAVGLLDADIYGPSQPRMMGIKGRPQSPDGKTLIPLENHGIKVMSIGFMLPEEQPIIWRGPMVMGALEQMLRDVAWGELDVLVVDLPPGTGDAQLTMAQRVPLAGAVIVSTPQDIALIDARKGLNMFRKVDVPVLGIVENMSYFLCPHCGERSDIFAHGGARREAEKLDTPFLGEIPLDMAIRETSDGGNPIVASAPDSPHSKAYRAIADKVWAQVEAKVGGGRQAPKIVIR